MVSPVAPTPQKRFSITLHYYTGFTSHYTSLTLEKLVFAQKTADQINEYLGEEVIRVSAEEVMA